jgi:FdrA protein
MVRKVFIISNTYQDSVDLMRLSNMATKVEGVAQASVMMGTALNKAVLQEVGLSSSEVDAAKPSDLMLVVQAESLSVADEVIALVREELNRDAVVDNQVDDINFSSIDEILDSDSTFNLAVISTAGEHASTEARKSLQRGLNVFIFSDNVSLTDEVELKNLAHREGLLVMGPDCGTSFLGGVPIGFVNRVNRGSIGIIGASGTGIQEVMCRIDALGGGVSHAIGTGSHDLSAEVAGISTLDAMAILERDSDTETIILISKPPEPEIAEKVYTAATKMSVPVVICFIGADHPREDVNLYFTQTLEEAAQVAVSLSNGLLPIKKEAERHLKIDCEQVGFLRGLYSGGTLAYEAIHLLQESGLLIKSNIAKSPQYLLKNNQKSEENTILDMGDDFFTIGRLHPMIDYTDRIKRLYEEFADPNVRVILMDIVTGYGSNMKPAEDLLPVISESLHKRPDIHFVVHICGTDRDPQSVLELSEALTDAGAIVEFNHVAAVEYARSLLFV